MDNSLLSLSSDSVKIKGVHYTVSNDFLKKADGEVQLHYKDLLSVELVKRRSKRAMYITLFLGSILVFILSFVRSNIEAKINDLITINSVQDAYETATKLYDTLQQGRNSEEYQQVANIVTALMIFTIIITIVGILYLFSGRYFAELTTMYGTYRVKVKQGDDEIKRIIVQVQKRITNG